MMPPPFAAGDILAGTYHMGLVVLSCLMAVFASFTTLSLAVCTRQSSTAAKKYWIAGDALAMGGGIWSMHFIGMLAFELPIPVNYAPGVTLFSLILAVAAAGYALHRTLTGKDRDRRTWIGSCVLGGGIVAMHYSGMLAMILKAEVRYDPLLVLCSMGIAVAASWAGLELMTRVESGSGMKGSFLKGAG